MPCFLHTIDLAAHVADLHKALKNAPKKNPHNVLGRLRGDAVAQIMSFVPFRKDRRGLEAVSPQTRLDSEMVLVDPLNAYSKPRVRLNAGSSDVSDAVADKMLLFRLDTDSKESNRQQIVLSLWWASRCGLPVELTMDNHDSEMLEHLGDALRSRVSGLTVTVCSPPAIVADGSASSSCTFPATVLASVLSFTNLQSLSIQGRGKRAYALEIAEVRSALTAAVSLPVAALQLHGWRALQDLNSIPGSRVLRSLTVSQCGLRTLQGLSKYPTLEKLKILSCPHITSVSALAGLSCLRSVEVCRCDLHSLDGLNGCLALTDVNVSGNCNLRSLSALAGLPLLQNVSACECDIRSVESLGSCEALTEINLSSNQQLRSLAALSKAPWLERVYVSGCDLVDLGDAGPWSKLEEIVVDNNGNLQSVSSLSCAPQLARVYAMNCGFSDTTELVTCPKLRKVYMYAEDYTDDEMMD